MSHSTSLTQTFCDHINGLCGLKEPAQLIDQIPVVEQRLRLLAFGIVAAKNHTNTDHWSALANISESWLFDPSQVAYKTSPQIQEGFQKLRIKVPKHISRVWWQISCGVQGRAKGSWLALIEANHKDAFKLLKYLQDSRTTFPVLSGPVLSVYWLDLVHRVGGVKLSSWDALCVTLPTELNTEAHLFGITKNEVHPMALRALQVWKQACRKGQDVSCGLSNCPR